MAFPVLLSADVVVDDAAPEAAEYAARALLTDSFSVNWCAEDAIALVDSFHSLEALNSDCRVSVKTCHGDLFPCGGGGGASFFFSCFPCSSFPRRPPVWSLVDSDLLLAWSLEFGSESLVSCSPADLPSSVPSDSAALSSCRWSWNLMVADVKDLEVSAARVCRLRVLSQPM